MSLADRPATALAALLAPALCALALALPAAAAAETATTGETTAKPPPAETTTTTVPAPAPEPPATTPAPAPAATAPATTAEPEGPAPSVQGQFSQGATGGSGQGSRSGSKARGGSGAAQSGSPANGGTEAAERAALAPGSLTPQLPFSLRSPFSGVPSFFIESFQIPPFLLPIFQAAGTAYGIPWQVLAAINEVETDYGRDLSVSSAGAEGWMQFLPSSWAQYGVDANGDGYRDPYNPADAIFAAARYLRAAGGDTNIRDAVFAYNHSSVYVESVMLRAQLLGGSPPELLGAVAGLTEARFPVHAAAHFSDGFPAGARSGGTVVGTAIYAAAGSPVIAVQDGQVVQIGTSPELGSFLVLRDAYGNTYTYGDLGETAQLYPVIEPRQESTPSARVQAAPPASEPAPSGPATAGAQPRSPLSEGSTVSGLSLGAAAGLEGAPPQASPSKAPAAPAPASVPRHFTSGSDEVFLRDLRPGAQVIAGTVLGHLAAAAAGGQEPHILFQIRPAGAGAPLIDPKPILDGWVALENTSIFRARGRNPFLATAPSAGQVLLESKPQLQRQVLHDPGISLGTCGRAQVVGGRVDRRLMAVLEYLSVSGLHPAVGGLACAQTAGADARTTETLDITAVNGTPIAGHEAAGSSAEATVRRLLMLEGADRPAEVASAGTYPSARGAWPDPRVRGSILVAFAAPTSARAAGLQATGLTPANWVRLISRLGEIPDPTVASKPSAAAIPDNSQSPGGTESGGNH